MLPEIKKAYLEGRVMLLLGAGASLESTDRYGDGLPLSGGLAKEVCEKFGLEYSGEDLGTVYSAIKNIDASGLHDYFRRRLTRINPSSALKVLAAFPWGRIYTLNIDDSLEGAFRDNGSQKYRVFCRNSPLEDADPIFQSVQIIKLNGSADNDAEGFIFSPQEYGDGSARIPIWYREIAQNYSNYVFLFIGSSLNEPLLQHAISELRSVSNRKPQRGYVITPAATRIQELHLQSLNLQHIPGSIQDFAHWLVARF